MIHRDSIPILRQLVVLLVASAWFPTAAHAVTLTVSPPSIAADYTGTITLNVAGLTSGQTVLMETFLDLDGNGTIDGGDMLIQSFQVTDGEAPSIGGVRNTNVPGDDNPTAGAIRAAVNFQALAEASKGVAKFVYRVSPATSAFTPVTAAFTITQPVYAQKVVGKVSSGGSAVPYAFTFLTDPALNRGPIVGAVADASGNFTLNAAPGSYAVIAIKAGFVSNFSTPPVVTVNAGATVPQNLSLTAADRTISGRLTDLDSGAGIPGVQVTAEAQSGLFALVFADASGNFSIPVSSTSSQWGVEASERSLALSGYLALNDRYGVDVGGVSASGVSIQLPKATALIYGTLTAHGNPLAGVIVYANNDQYESSGLTDSSGRYVVGVVGTTDGSWHVQPDSAALAPLGYLTPSANVSVSAGQAVEQDLVAPAVTAHLIGRATDDGGSPVDNACLGAWSDQGGNIDGTTDSNGNFGLGVVGGTWHLQLCGDDARQRGLVRPTLTRSVQDGVDVTGIQYVALRSTYQITGGVHDGGGNPLSSVRVYANATINNTNYNAQADTGGNGNYALPVVNGDWNVNLECNDLSARGLPCPSGQPVTVSGQNQTLDFCVGCGPHLRGTVFDDLGNRVSSIHISAVPQFGGSGSEGLTDGGGNFDIALGSSSGTWNLQLNQAEAAQRSLVSPSVPETVNNNDINGIFFVAKHSTSLITGAVTDTNGNPVVGVNVFANAYIDPVSYSVSATSGDNGGYQLPVINATWSVGISCNDLQARGFNCTANQYAPVNNNNPVVNFVVQAVLRVTTASLPVATQRVAYVAQLEASGGLPPYTWSLGADTPFLPPSLGLDASSGSISGTPVINGTFGVHVRVTDHNGQMADGNFTLTINPSTGPTVTPTATPTPTPTPGPCVGDCGNDGQVTVDEIIHMVNIALGNADVSTCLTGDANHDEQVTIDEILTAVNNALNGC